MIKSGKKADSGNYPACRRRAGVEFPEVHDSGRIL